MSERENNPAEERAFTGYFRFPDKEAELKGWIYVDQIPGSYNVLESPFAESEQMVYRMTSWQFKLLEKKLVGEGINFEVVEWPKDAKHPFVWPPGLSGLP